MGMVFNCSEVKIGVLVVVVETFFCNLNLVFERSINLILGALYEEVAAALL